MGVGEGGGSLLQRRESTHSKEAGGAVKSLNHGEEGGKKGEEPLP